MKKNGRMDIRNKLQARLKLTSSQAQLNVLEIECDITAFFYIIHSGRIKWYLKDLYGFDGEKSCTECRTFEMVANA